MELNGYRFAEKVFTISDYDNSILGCNKIVANTFPYYPNKSDKKKISQIKKYRKENMPKIINNGHILVLGTVTNPPTKIGVLKIINSLEKSNIRKPIKLAGFGTNELKSIDLKKVEVLGSVSDEELIDLMQNAICLIINQHQTSGFLIKIVEFNLASIPILVTSNYYQAKNLEEYGIFAKKYRLSIILY